MDEQQKWAVARVALDAVGEKYDYALAGSMALRAHGLADRPVDDIDLFNAVDTDGAAARAEVVQALTEAGYEVAVEKVWALNQAANLSVADPRRPDSEPVTVQMVPMQTNFYPAEIDGLRVLAVEDCVQMKAEAIEWRTEAKDFIDLNQMNTVLGPDVVDAHLVANNRSPVDPVIFRSQLGQVAEIPDESFARYEVDAFEAAEIRMNILSWTTELAADQPNPLQVQANGPAAGVQALYLDQAEAAAERISANQPQSLLTDHDLTMEAARSRRLAEVAESEAHKAAQEAGWMRDNYEASGGGSFAAMLRDQGADPELVQRAVNSEQEDVKRKETLAGELQYQAEGLREKADTLDGELERRAELEPEERAAETTVRRELKGQATAKQEPSWNNALARATAPTPHQRQAARA
ncbi:nucleotidyl transferase AbiEii/AbiGii toxin family protein [Kitasatospora sp. NPDC094028]